jgi:hypothetical protein
VVMEEQPRETGIEPSRTRKLLLGLGLVGLANGAGIFGVTAMDNYPYYLPNTTEHAVGYAIGIGGIVLGVAVAYGAAFLWQTNPSNINTHRP